MCLYLMYKMTACVQDDWVSGMWHVFSGFVISTSAFVSVLVVAPLFADDR